MKSILIAAILLVTCHFFSKADELILSSEIESVTVFRQGAEVKRTSNKSIPAGVSTLIINNLASGINPASVQVKVPANVTLLSAAHRLNYMVQQQKSKAQLQIEDSIEIVNLFLKRVQNDIHALQEEEDLLKQNKNIGGKNTGIDLAELKSIASYFRIRIKEIRDEVVLLQIKEKKRNRKLADLNKQLVETAAMQNKAIGEIVLEVSTNIPQSAAIELTYIVQQASWSPLYDIRSESISKQAKLTYKAAVQQNTGVDWKGVNLTISTGNPSVNQNRPILNPWFINFAEYVTISSADKKASYSTRNLALEKSESGAYSNADADDLSYGSISNYTVAQQNQLNVSFKISLPYDILSNNKQQIVAMKDYDLKTEYQYHVVPKLDTDAFLLAKVSNWESLSLLPGNANIFFEGTYVGQSYINPQIAVDTMLLSLGRDKRIVVKREKVEDLTSSSFIGFNKQESFTYKTTIRNTKNTAVQIELLDHIPIPQNDDIKVSLEESTNAKYNKEVGKLSWLLNLGPGESKDILLTYTVKYPKSKQVPGL